MTSISSVVDDLAEAGRGDYVSIGDVLDAFQHRSLGVLLTVFSLIAALPVVGGIPGVSLVAATLILLAVGQSVLGGGPLWMPAVVRRRKIGREKLRRGLAIARAPLEWIDALLRPRLKIFVVGRLNRWIVTLDAVLLAIAFFPLDLIPYAVTAPAFGVLALGLGLIACDGLMILVGYGLTAATGYLLLLFV